MVLKSDRINTYSVLKKYISFKIFIMDNLNVFGQPLISCSSDPLTGFFRDGCCNTDEQDLGLHTVCIIATDEFLTFSKTVGNDLSTPYPPMGFNGLKAGEQWCLCAARYKEAYEHGFAPKVVLEATNEKTLEIVSMESLLANAHYSKKV